MYKPSVPDQECHKCDVMFVPPCEPGEADPLQAGVRLHWPGEPGMGVWRE